MNRALAFLLGLIVPVMAGATQYHMCHYGEACRVPFTLYDYTDPTDPEATTSVAIVTGDVYWTCILSGTSTQDASTILTGDITEIGGISFELELGATETDCERIKVDIVDAAGDVWFPHTIVIDTVGNALAGVEGILTSVPNNVSTANLDTAADTVTVTALAANVITDTSLAGGLEIVFETDFATNYNTTRDAWETNLTDTIGTLVGGEIAVGAFAAGAITDAAVVDTALGEATSNWATATGFATTAEIADVPTVAEFNARTIASASYFDPAADPVANVTTVATLSGHTAQTADHTAGIADIPTVAEFNARTLVAASYFDPAADAVADVTLVATTTTNSDMVSEPLDAAGIRTATGLASANLDTQITGLNTNIDATQTTIGTAGAGLTDLGGMSTGMQAEVEAEATDAIEADFLQYLFAATYDPASKPGQADALLNELIGDDSGVSQFTINALERAPSGTGLTPIATGTASAGAAGSITLAVAETFAADELNGAVVQLTGGTGAGQSRCITDYGVSADLAEVNTNWITNPVAASSTYEIWPSFGLCPDTTTTVASDVADAVWDEAKADHTTSTTFGDLPPALLVVDNLVDDLETRVSFVIPGDATAIASDVIEFEGAPDAAAAIESEVDDALVVRELHHLVNVADADSPADNSIVAKLAADDGDWSNYVPANDSQEAIRDRGDANWETGTGTGLTGVTGTTQNTSAHDATTIQLESGEVVNNDDFLGWWIQITSGNCANQKAKVTASVASTDTVTVRPPLRTGAICTSLVTGLNSVTYELAPYGG